MFTMTYSCRVEIIQNLPDNTPVKSLEELNEDFRHRLVKILESESDMIIKVSHGEVNKTASPFD